MSGTGWLLSVDSGSIVVRALKKRNRFQGSGPIGNRLPRVAPQRRQPRAERSSLCEVGGWLRQRFVRRLKVVVPAVTARSPWPLCRLSALAKIMHLVFKTLTRLAIGPRNQSMSCFGRGSFQFVKDRETPHLGSGEVNHLCFTNDRLTTARKPVGSDIEEPWRGAGGSVTTTHRGSLGRVPVVRRPTVDPATERFRLEDHGHPAAPTAPPLHTASDVAWSKVEAIASLSRHAQR